MRFVHLYDPRERSFDRPVDQSRLAILYTHVPVQVLMNCHVFRVGFGQNLEPALVVNDRPVVARVNPTARRDHRRPQPEHVRHQRRARTHHRRNCGQPTTGGRRSHAQSSHVHRPITGDPGHPEPGLTSGRRRAMGRGGRAALLRRPQILRYPAPGADRRRATHRSASHRQPAHPA